MHYNANDDCDETINQPTSWHKIEDGPVNVSQRRSKTYLDQYVRLWLAVSALVVNELHCHRKHIITVTK